MTHRSRAHSGPRHRARELRQGGGMSASLPYEEQVQRAKWDMLLFDVESRMEQVSRLKLLNPLRLRRRYYPLVPSLARPSRR